MNKQIEELKPCPFCGGDAVFKPDNIYSANPRNIHASWVMCSKCDAEGKHFNDRHNTNCQQQAIDAWNTRTCISPWKPIDDNIPKDGTEIVVRYEYKPPDERVYVGVHYTETKWVEDYNGNEFWANLDEHEHITHYTMPL